MLQQESSNYNPTGFSGAAFSGEHGMDAVAAASGGRVSPASRQRMSQQQLLRHSLGGRASYVSGMRSSTAYATPPDSVGSAQPLIPTSNSPPPADAESGGAAYNGCEVEAVPVGSAQQQQQQSYTPPQDALLTAVGEDFVHEVLAMNTMAMEQCYAALGSGPSSSMTAATEEPMKILREAFMRLDDTSAQDLPAPLLDQLKATTMNNMGVVECNRGQPRQALSHFEAARQLEENNDMSSPSVALNTCAAYNALRMYDKATAAALEAIDMLRALEVQRQRSRLITAAVARQQSPTPPSHRSKRGGETGDAMDGAQLNEALLLEAAAAPQIAESENAALWGAAWNNLAVAQINTSREGASKDTSEYTNTLTLFQNAMRATQELLGPQHPMSKAVVETYRSVRLALRSHGAFKQHRTLLRAPLPPVDPREQAWEEEQVEAAAGQTRHNALVKQRQQLTITFRGEVTGGQKLVERVDGTPYPGAPAEAYQTRRSGGRSVGGSSARTNSSNRKGKRTPSSKQRSNAALRGMPHSETLTRASVVYGNPHPLLYTPPPTTSSTSAQAGTARAPPREKEGDNAGNTARSADGSRHGHPSPPHPPPHLPRQPRSQREQHSAPLRHNSRSSRNSLLPPIGQGKRTDQLAMDDDEMDKTNGTTASSVYMHVPPPAPPLHNSPSASSSAATAAAAHLQHSKMLLLASPSMPVATAETYADRFGGPDAPRHMASQRGPSPTQGDLNNSSGPLTPSPARSEDDERDGNDASATDAAQPSHELFQGMWVTADAHYVHRGPRVFGKPVYYTISTTLDVDEEGVSSAPQSRSEGGSQGRRTPSTEAPAARNTLPTLTYSGSSSSSGDGDGAETAGSGGSSGQPGRVTADSEVRENSRF